VGAGLPPYRIGRIVAVTKAYSSAVGAGAFTSEIFGPDAEQLRRLGGDAGEFGATTGRSRRMGWFDCVATRYGCEVQGATEAVLTAIDVLGYLDRIPVCTGYEIDGTRTDTFPVTGLLNRAKPVLEWLPGWKTDLRGMTRWEDLPAEAKAYVAFIEQRIGVPIRMVSTGPRREEIIYR
jgi:adenylosuccinate synthase